MESSKRSLLTLEVRLHKRRGHGGDEIVEHLVVVHGVGAHLLLEHVRGVTEGAVVGRAVSRLKVVYVQGHKRRNGLVSRARECDHPACAPRAQYIPEVTGSTGVEKVCMYICMYGVVWCDVSTTIAV